MTTSPIPSSTQKNILILGASFAGISSAHYLLKHYVSKLPDPSSYRIILVSPSLHAMCRQACPRALISDHFFDQSKIFVSIPEQFEQYPKENFLFVQGAVTAVDLDARTAFISTPSDDSSNDDNVSVTETVAFHSLVVATGASTPSPLFGFNSGNRDSLRASWEAFRKALPNAKKIVIAGGGPAGIETAAELGEYLNGRPGFFSKGSQNVDITVVCGAERILPALRPSLANKAERMLAKLGVTVLKSIRVCSLEPAGSGEELDNLTSQVKIRLNNGQEIDADLYIPATGTRPNTSFLPNYLLGADGRTMANSQTFRVSEITRVYAIGDCSSAFRPAVHNIAAAIPTLAANIYRDLLFANGVRTDVPEDRLFKEDTRETQMVPIGTKGGVGASWGWAFPSWAVWLLKGRDYWLWTTPALWSGKQWNKAS